MADPTYIKARRVARHGRMSKFAALVSLRGGLCICWGSFWHLRHHDSLVELNESDEYMFFGSFGHLKNYCGFVKSNGVGYIS